RRRAWRTSAAAHLKESASQRSLENSATWRANEAHDGIILRIDEQRYADRDARQHRARTSAGICSLLLLSSASCEQIQQVAAPLGFGTSHAKGLVSCDSAAPRGATTPCR